MPWELFDVGNDQGFPLRGGGSADSLPERDVETPKTALIRPDAKEPARYNDAVETGPEITESMVDQRGNRRHPRDIIIHAAEYGIGVPLEFSVRASPRHATKIGNCFCHSSIEPSPAPAGRIRSGASRQTFPRGFPVAASQHPIIRVRESACPLRAG